VRLPWARKAAPEELLTSIACASCRRSAVRAHAEGDAVFGEAKCPSCGAAARVDMIYSGRPMRG